MNLDPEMVKRVQRAKFEHNFCPHCGLHKDDAKSLLKAAQHKPAAQYVYTAEAEGGNGIYHHENFLGTAFSIDELRGLMERCHGGPVPGERYNLQRRKIGAKKSEYLTVWRTETWDDLETRTWR